jgi:hypothetical protein
MTGGSRPRTPGGAWPVGGGPEASRPPALGGAWRAQTSACAAVPVPATTSMAPIARNS